MYSIVAGGGKVGANVARSLLGMGHEVTLIEQRPYRFDQLQDEFEHQVLLGDATELHVLERAGIARPPELVLGVTGDDEDNLIICQIATEGYRVPKVIARVNDPRNQEHFDLLGISQTVCATSNVLGLVEHEVPEHGIVHLLELRKENLEIVELQIEKNSPAAGKRVAGLRLPDGTRLISVMRQGRSELAEDSTVIRPGDQVLAVLEPGKEDELRRVLLATLGVAPVVARDEHDDRDDLETAHPHQPGHQQGREVAEGLERAERAADAEGRPDVREHARGDGDRVERRQRRARFAPHRSRAGRRRR